MSQVFAAERIEKRGADFILICILVIMLGLGLVALFSSSYFRAAALYGNPLQFFLNQSVYAGIGLVLAFITSRLPLDGIRRFIPWLLLLSLAMMLLTFLPGIGATFLGGRRWIVLFGFSFQPSELVKLSLVLYLASVLDKKQDRLNRPSQSIIPAFFIVFIFTVLIFLQNNFSTAVFVLLVALGVFFAAGVKLRWFAAGVLLVTPLAIFSVLSREHRLERFLSFLKPEEDPMGSGYQVLASLSALRLGGFGGVGMGQGSRKLGTLPEAQSDFIFAVWGEELGFIGVLGVISLFCCFAWRGYRIASLADSLYLRLLAFGITTSIVLQAMINMAVVSGMLPATGIPLPMFSSGGSSMMMTLAMCGFLINVSRSTGLEYSNRHQEVGHV